jgi:integrase
MASKEKCADHMDELTKKRRTRGTGSYRKIGDGKYELRYCGKSETMEAKTKKDAERALSDWVEALDKKLEREPDVSLNWLLDMHLADKRRKKRKDIRSVEKKINKHIRPKLGNLDARLLTKSHLTTYIDGRLKQNAAAATVNRELSAIRRALHMGLSEELIEKVISFKELMLPEDNTRQGFVEEETYREMLLALPSHLKMPWVFSYYTGMRSGEILLLQWLWVDWSRWIIVIPVGVTKNKNIRIIPVYDEMREHLKLAYQMRNPACPYVFQHEGCRLKSFRTAFENTRSRVRLTKLLPKPLAERISKLNQKQLTAFDWCPDAEVPPLFERALTEKLTAKEIKDSFPGNKPTRILFHDQRRTAVRNMERAKIQRTTARQVSGHKTESVYIRYAIGAEKDVLELGEQMANFHRSEREKLAARTSVEAEIIIDSGIRNGMASRKSKPAKTETNQ